MREPIVLCYHAIGNEWPSAVTPERLRRQVELLLRRGYEPRTFADVVGSPRASAFAVTFDDAYLSVLDAVPVLRRLDVTATVFVVTSFAEGGLPLEWPGLDESGVSRDPERRRSLSWAELRSLADLGWEIGSHTHTHPYLTRLDDETLEFELGYSLAACSNALGRPCRSIAYPYGDVDARVASAAAAVGYEAGCSLSIATSGPLSWPRIGVYMVDTTPRFRLKVSPTVLRIRKRLSGAQAAAV